jgi:hypothetical protein
LADNRHQSVRLRLSSSLADTLSSSRLFGRALRQGLTRSRDLSGRHRNLVCAFVKIENRLAKPPGDTSSHQPPRDVQRDEKDNGEQSNPV